MAHEMQRCPVCGRDESERFELEGRWFVVFPCQFTLEAEPGTSEERLTEQLEAARPKAGQSPFQPTCDRLHLYVTKGAGASALRPEQRGRAPSAGPRHAAGGDPLDATGSGTPTE